MIGNWLRRVVSHFIVLMLLPLAWWFASPALLVVIHLNTAGADWVIHEAVRHIPDPQIQKYVRWSLKPGEWFSAGLRMALGQVDPEYRDRVEVLVRLKYDPGAWFMVAEFGTGVYFFWAWRRHRRQKQKEGQILPQPLEPPRPRMPEGKPLSAFYPRHDKTS